MLVEVFQIVRFVVFGVGRQTRRNATSDIIISVVCVTNAMCTGKKKKKSTLNREMQLTGKISFIQSHSVELCFEMF